MPRLRTPLLVVGLTVAVLIAASMRPLVVLDPARFVQDVGGTSLGSCAAVGELAHRYHRGPNQCALYHCWWDGGGDCGISVEARRIYSRFEVDARSSGFGDRIPELLPLFRQWTDIDEREHDWPAEQLEEIRRHASFLDRVRIALNRDRLLEYLSRTSESGTVVEPPPLVHRDADEYRRLRDLWRRNKMAPMAKRLVKLAC